MSFPKQLDELKPLKQWVAYRLVWNEKKGKADKRPINPHDGTGAKANDPATWGTYDEAMSYAQRQGLIAGKSGGVGFEFGGGYCGIDLDNVVQEDGRLKDFASEIVEVMGSYTEYSPSHKGLHILCKLSVSMSEFGTRRRNDEISLEMYDSGRFFTVTGEATSDFRIQDIMDNDSPVSLYLVLNPTNIQRLKPLVRLFISQLVFILMPEMEFSGGQMKAPYKHRLLLLLDEFPALGKLGIFEQAIAYFGGRNIKAYLICQDKAQLDAAYGKDESITSNCHVTVAYAPNKVETAKYLSDRLGVTTVIKEQESISFQGGTGLFAKKSVTKSQQEVQRAVLTPDEIMRLPGPIKDVYQNITEPGDMLVFAAGFPPVYGKQILYFLDKTFSERSKIDSPEKSDNL